MAQDSEDTKTNKNTELKEETITAGDVYNIFQGLHFDLTYLIFDIRGSKKEYIKSHIISSIHLNCNIIKKNKNNKDILNKIKFFDLKMSRKLKAW
eukprot:331470_1